MNEKKFAEEFGRINSSFIDEALDYKPENKRGGIYMSKKKIFTIAIAAVLAIGAMAVTAFSKEPLFRENIQEVDINDYDLENPVVIHDLSELDELPPNTPFVLAPELEMTMEYGYALPDQPDFDPTYPVISDVIVNGGNATVIWYDQNDNETSWIVGFCPADERILKNVAEVSEPIYTFENLEPGEYRVAICGITPDEGDPYETSRISTNIIFTVEDY